MMHETHETYGNIWTDGACCGNGTPNSRGGCGIYIPSHNISIAHRIDSYNNEPVTNNIAELMAIKLSLEWIITQPPMEFVLYSDSQYSINCITTWRSGWERNGLKLSSGKPIKNIELIQSIWKLLDMIPNGVEIKYVKAHVNPRNATELEKNNQVADDLATSCIAVKQEK
jgi:ribonuclease HI